MTQGLLVVDDDPCICLCKSARPYNRALAEIKRLAGSVLDSAIASASLNQERMAKE